MYSFTVDQLPKKQCEAHAEGLGNCVSQLPLENTVLQAWE